MVATLFRFDSTRQDENRIFGHAKKAGSLAPNLGIVRRTIRRFLLPSTKTRVRFDDVLRLAHPKFLHEAFDDPW